MAIIRVQKGTKDILPPEMPVWHFMEEKAAEVFAKYGLGCIGCAAARFENLEAGAKVHGVDPDVMVDEINALIEANE